MPTITTRGAMSAQGFGFASASLGGPYYIGYYDYAYNATSANSFAVVSDTSSNSYFLGELNSYANYSFFSYNKSGTLVTQKSITGPSTAVFNGAVIDSSNNIYAINSQSSGTKYIMKLNSSGSILFQRYIQPSGFYNFFADNNQKGPYIAIDSSNNIYTVQTSYTLGCPCCYIIYPYLVGIDSSGTKVFSEIITGIPVYLLAGIASDGTYIYTLTDGGTNAQNLTKHNSSGTMLASWKITYGNSYSIKADSSSNVYVAGKQSGMYIAKINGSSILWQRTIGYRGYGDYFFNSIALDSSSNVYVAGYDVALVPASSPNLYYSIIQLAKYNSSGTIQWQRSITWNGSTNLYHSKNLNIQSIAIDANGDLIITAGMAYYDTSSLNNTGAFTMKVPTDGSRTGTYTVGSESFTYAVSTQTSATPSTPTISATSVSVFADTGGVGATGYSSSTASYTSTVVAI